MEDKRCYMTDCENELCGRCDCIISSTYFCQLHMSSHFESESNIHRLVTVQQEKSTLLKSKVIKRLNELKSEAQRFSKQLENESLRLMNCVKNNLEITQKNILALTSQINKMIIKIINNNNDHVADTDLIDATDINYTNFRLKYIDVKFPSISFQVISKNLCEEFKNKINPYVHRLEEYDKPFYNTQLSFFRHCTNQLVNLEIKDMNASLKSIEISESVRTSISICLLPDQTMFCYGNSILSRCLNEVHTGLAFSVDQNNHLKLHKTGKENFYLNSVYHNGQIFAFGGVNKLAERFDLYLDRWESCKDLPDGNYKNSFTCIVQNKLCVVGYHLNEVTLYDILNDSYEKIPNLALGGETTKCIFYDNQKAFLLEFPGKIYETVDLIIWEIVGSISVELSSVISYSVCYKSCFYIVSNQYQLLEFSTKTRILKLLKII